MEQGKIKQQTKFYFPEFGNQNNGKCMSQLENTSFTQGSVEEKNIFLNPRVRRSPSYIVRRNLISFNVVPGKYGLANVKTIA